MKGEKCELGRCVYEGREEEKLSCDWLEGELWRVVDVICEVCGGSERLYIERVSEEVEDER